MLVKIFRNKGAGSAGASADYLLGKDREREDARILLGDPELTATLADSLDFKNRYTVGCMSFEEQAKDFTDERKLELIDRFEITIFAGMDRSQYSIAWIEHADKGGRLELNFLVANVELNTGKRLQPYYDKTDRKLVDSFQTVINHEYGFSDPHDPMRRSWYDDLNVKNLSPSAKEAKQQINEYINTLIDAGEIKDRDDIVTTLHSNGFEVTRVTDKAISIKDPDGGRNIRLTGAMYEKATDFRQLESQAEGNTRTYAGERDRTYRAALERLESLVQGRERVHQTKYERGVEIDVASPIYRDVHGIGIDIVRSTDTHELLQVAGTGGYEERNRGTQGDRPVQELQIVSGAPDIRDTGRVANHLDQEGRTLHFNEWLQRYTDKVKEYAKSIGEFAQSCFDRLRGREQEVNLASQTIERADRETTQTDRGIGELKYEALQREPEIERSALTIKQADRTIDRTTRKERSIGFDLGF